MRVNGFNNRLVARGKKTARLRFPDRRAIESKPPDTFRCAGLFSGVPALGGGAVQAPNLNQLKADGIAFTNAYLMGSFSGATCIPNRASPHTGRHLFSLEGVEWQIPPTHTTIGEAFHQAGYRTQLIGKWHQDTSSLVYSFNSGAALMGLSLYLVNHFHMPLWKRPPREKFETENG